MINPDSIKTVILGIGNILLGDEGIGIHAVKKLKKEKLPSDVLIIDGSTAGFRLLAVFETYKNCKFIIIDAVKISDTSPGIKRKMNLPGRGEIYLIPLNKLYSIAASGTGNKDFISFHQTGLIDVLQLLGLTQDTKIHGYLIGVNIGDRNASDKNPAISLKLSTEIKRKIPDLLKLAKKYM